MLKGRGDDLRGRSSETRGPGAYCTLIPNPGSQLSHRLRLPEEPELDMEQCCFLVAIFYNNIRKSCAAGYLIFMRI